MRCLHGLHRLGIPARRQAIPHPRGSPARYLREEEKNGKYKRPRACATRGLLVGGPVDGLVAAFGLAPKQPSHKRGVILECKPDPRVGFDNL